MIRDPSRLTVQSFDLLIVGGGIMGAGIAWDAALRGFSCALVEQGDLASGTSSKTTKLIHGGIRYLENFQFRLVRQSIRERALLLKQAPYLVRPLTFLIPVMDNSPRPWPLVKFGVTLYDLLARGFATERHRFLNSRQVQEAEPLLSHAPVFRGAIFHDAQMDDAGLVLQVLKAAAQAGAVVINHCPVLQWQIEKGRIKGAEVEDRISGGKYQVKATVVINATGPWVDPLRRLADPSVRPLVRPSKGIHIVYPDVGLKHALLLSAGKDRRIFFLIPWTALTLIGTTDTDFPGDPSQARADREDVEYLVKETNRLLPRLKLEKEKILSTFAGVRPLVAQEKKDPWAVSRAHLLHEDSNGLVSLVGGKFTTFRSIAEEVVDSLEKRFPGRKIKTCQTADSPLGPGRWQTEEVKELLQILIHQGELYPPLVSRLIQRYGVGAQKILQWIREDPRQGDPLCPHHPFTRAEVRYAVQEEMAMNLVDLIFRRLEVGYSLCQGLDMAEPAGFQMGRFLGWSEQERLRQMERYHSEVKENHRWKTD